MSYEVTENEVAVVEVEAKSRKVPSAFVIPLKHLAVAFIFTARKAVQYYLNGVCVEVGPQETNVVGTDGHYMGVMKNKLDHRFNGSIIIPNETVDSIIKANVTKQEDRFAWFKELEGGAWEAETLGGTFKFKPIEGSFPDWRRVIPETVSNEPAQFNLDFLVKFSKAKKLLGSVAWPRIHHNGAGGASRVEFMADPEFTGVIMSLRL